MKLPFSVKSSVAFSALALAVIGGVFWHNGPPLPPVSVDPEERSRATKRNRGDHEAATEGRRATAALIVVANEWEVLRTSRDPSRETARSRILDSAADFHPTDPARLKALLAGLRAGGSLEDRHTGLAFLVASLARWMNENPAEAIEWFRKNGGQFPDLLTEDAKTGLLQGFAAGNPGFAFQLIGEEDFKNLQDNPLAVVIRAADTPERRSATLATFRVYLGTLSDENAREIAANVGITLLAREAVRDGFDSATGWIAGAGLSPEELGSIAPVVASSAKTGETDRWIPWLDENLPAPAAAEGIRLLFANWSRVDDEAAGAWITSAADGPARNAAIRAYAANFAYSDPEIISLWVDTLPPGKDKERTLARVYEEWPKTDAASRQSAEAFAASHGIKR